MKKREETDDLLSKYEEIEAKIREQSPRYAALTRPQPLGAREIQQQVLDADTLLLEFSLGQERSYLWLVSHNAVKSFEFPKQAEIEQAARHVYELLTARSQHIKFETDEERRARITRADAEYPQAAALLSRMLLNPVAAELGKKCLLIVADGALYYIPFAALPEPASSNGQPLVINHQIVNSPSASALAELRRDVAGREPAPRELAVLADPLFDRNDARVKAGSRARLDKVKEQSGQSNNQNSNSNALPNQLASAVGDSGDANETQLTRLPFTRLEAKAILALAPAASRMEALDFAANLATATSRELAQYRIVHFATHGFLDSVRPELSGIVLSLVDEQGSVRDGFLAAHDIYNLKLPTELVVLSGCRTGLGQEIKGEGLVGLTRGFMYAGAARVLVSLWDVNDEATSELMSRFYKGLLSDEHLSASVALRRAQISMLRASKWQAPYYWSSFILQGEPH